MAGSCLTTTRRGLFRIRDGQLMALAGARSDEQALSRTEQIANEVQIATRIAAGGGGSGAVVVTFFDGANRLDLSLRQKGHSFCRTVSCMRPALPKAHRRWSCGWRTPRHPLPS